MNKDGMHATRRQKALKALERDQTNSTNNLVNNVISELVTKQKDSRTLLPKVNYKD